MPDYTLKAAPPLGGARQAFEELLVEEVTNQAVVACAMPLGGETEFKTALQSTYQLELPDVGRLLSSETTGNTRILRMATDQCFLMFDDPGGDPAVPVRDAFGAASYTVDQSDSWVILRLTGKRAIAALERMCPLDVSGDRFPPGSVARTVMEHHATIILRESQDGSETENDYLLLSPRSSAKSFLHVVLTSASNVT